MDKVIEKQVGIDSSYKEETIESIEVLQSSSNLTRIAYDYGFGERNQLIDKIPEGSKILILGSGEGSLVEDIKRRCFGVSVTDLNPAFVKLDFPGRSSRTDNAVSAVNPNLPFADSSFDLIIDDFASVYYSRKDIDESVRRIREITRVLKGGGMALVGPMVGIKEAEVLYQRLLELNIKATKVNSEYADGKVILPHFVIKN